MGLRDLSFSMVDGRWLSEVFVPERSNMAVGVKFLGSPGAVVVERSIDDGTNWVVAGAIASVSNDSMYVLENVCGFVVGEFFRVVTTEEPESIHVLE